MDFRARLIEIHNMMRDIVLTTGEGMRKARVGFMVLLAAVAAPGALLAQGGVGVRVFPRMGIAAPDGYFYEYFANFYGDGPMEWTTGSLGRAFSAGLGLEIAPREGNFLIRAEVLRTFDGWLSSVYSLERPRVLFEPPQIDNTWLDIPTSITQTSLQVVLPLRLELWSAEPYVLGGVGGKLYDFGSPVADPGVNATLPSDGFTWGGDLGVGVVFPFWRGLRVDLQVRDAVSRYWGKTQHDLLYTGAVLWQVWGG